MYDFELEQQEISDFIADMLTLGAEIYQEWIILMEQDAQESAEEEEQEMAMELHLIGMLEGWEPEPE